MLCRWAAKSILMGYGILPTPSNRYELFNNPTLSTWLTFPAELSHSDVTWVGFVGKFRSHWALLKPSEPPPRVSSYALLASPAAAANCFLDLFLTLSHPLIFPDFRFCPPLTLPHSLSAPCALGLVIASLSFPTIFFKTTLSTAHSIITIHGNVTAAPVGYRCA